MSHVAARWVEILNEQTQRTEEYRRGGEQIVADLLLGREVTVLGHTVRVTGVEWTHGEPHKVQDLLLIYATKEEHT